MTWFQRRSRKPKRKPIKLHPEVKVQRLNRRALVLIALAGIAALWSMLYVVSSKSRDPEPRPSRWASYEVAQPDWEAILRQAEERQRREQEAATRLAAERLAESLRPQSPQQAHRAARSVDESNRAPLVAAGFDRQALGNARRAAGHLEQAARDALRSIEQIGADITEPAPLADGVGRGDTADRRREAFLRQAAERGESPSLESRIQTPSPETLRKVLLEGTLIPAVLVGGIHSELPGPVMALVRDDVFDSIRGEALLIPRGARLVGTYDHAVAWGQRRVLVAWNRLVLPDGRSLELRGMPGADAQGRAGLGDQVDRHLTSTFGQALMLSAISAGVQLGQPQESASGGAPSARQVAAGAVAQELGRTATEVIRRQIDRPPTLEVRPGYRFHVVVTADTVVG